MKHHFWTRLLLTTSLPIIMAACERSEAEKQDHHEVVPGGGETPPISAGDNRTPGVGEGLYDTLPRPETQPQ